MIIKPFGEEGISMLQGNRKDVAVTDYICNLLEEDGGVVTGDFIDEVQKATIQNGKVKRVPYNPKVVDLINDKNNGTIIKWGLYKKSDFIRYHSTNDTFYPTKNVINSFGIRGPELEEKNSYRVLMIGDSFLQADEVDFVYMIPF